MIPRSVDDLKRRNRGLTRIAEATVGLMGRTPDYMNVKFAELRRARTGLGRAPDGRTRRAPHNLVAFQRRLGARGHLAHPHDHPSDDRQGDRRADRRQPRARAQGRRDRRTASSCAARASSPRWRRSPTRSPCIPAHPLPAGAEAYALAFSIPRRHAGPDLPVPRQRGRARRRPVRPAAVDALRRAGRVRDLRRRRDPARAAVPRRPPRRLQHRRHHRAARQHDEPDHHPRADQARVRVRTRHAHGRGDRRHEPGDAGDARRAPGLRRGHAQRRAALRRARPRHRQRRVVPGRPRRCTRCARCSPRGSRA